MERLNLNTTQLGEVWSGNRQTAQHWIKGASLPKAGEVPRLCRLLAIDANELLNVSPTLRLEGLALDRHRESILSQWEMWKAENRPQKVRKGIAKKKKPVKKPSSLRER